MARPPLLTAQNLSLRFGDKNLLREGTFHLYAGDKIALVGRNGCGKSTLMRVLAGSSEDGLEKGRFFYDTAAESCFLPQSLPRGGATCVRDLVMGGGTESSRASGEPFLASSAHPQPGREAAHDVPAHVAEKYLDFLSVPPDRGLDRLSGGEWRRVLLARTLARPSNVLFLDEPTNHLDIQAIVWLENYLASYRGAMLIISHDRRFLEALTSRVFWLERGILRACPRGFAHFDAWCEEVVAHEAQMQLKMDRKISDELRWLQRGVTARRKRNQGRLERLDKMRQARAARDKPSRGGKLRATHSSVQSQMIVDAENLSYALPTGRKLVDNLTLRILKGERLGLIGQNGAGKTTLIRLLLDELKPQAGRVCLGETLEVGIFSQEGHFDDLRLTPWRYLCEDGGDYITVGAARRHVVGYLKDFLFDDKQAREPIAGLSGGEKNRLRLAKILAAPTNFLILDEPTNDLDADTLELLQDMLLDYKGTALIVSHDRDFLDKTTTSLLVFEGEGHIREYLGGYTDYQREEDKRRAREGAPRERREDKPVSVADSKEPLPPKVKTGPQRLSYKQKQGLETLPGIIEALEARISDLEKQLADPGLYARDLDEFDRLTSDLAGAKREKSAAEEEWLDLIALLE